MSQIIALLQKLREEIADDVQFDEFIDDLQMFIDQRDDEEIVGLENKLGCVLINPEVPFVSASYAGMA